MIPPRKNGAGVVLVHYQTIEEVAPEDVGRLKILMKGLRRAGIRMGLWRKSDLLLGLEPAGAVWGYGRAKCEEEIRRLMAAVTMFSRTIPWITWVVYVEGNGGEVMLRNGKCIAYQSFRWVNVSKET